MSSRETDAAGERLQRLRDQLNDALGKSSTPLRHVLRLRNNEHKFGVDELDDWARSASALLTRGAPLSLLSHWDCTWNPFGRELFHAYFAEDGHEAEVEFFHGLARQAYDAATRYLEGSGHPYQLVTAGVFYPPPRPRLASHYWVHGCYNLTWDHPGRLNYQIDGIVLPARRPGTVPPPAKLPFADRQGFEDWGGDHAGKAGQPSLPQGRSWLWLSEDVRFCSVEAIDLVLGMEKHLGEAKQPICDRLKLVKVGNECSCSLDEISYIIEYEQYLLLVGLVAQRGHPIGVRRISGLENGKIERVRKRLPRQLRDLIRANQQGTWLAE